MFDSSVPCRLRRNLPHLVMGQICFGFIGGCRRPSARCWVFHEVADGFLFMEMWIKDDRDYGERKFLRKRN